MDPSGNPGARGDAVKLFTVDEANALLEVIRPLMEDLAECKRGLDAVHATLLRLTPKQRANGHRLDALGLEHQMERLVDRLSRGIRDLELLGVEVKDLDTGLIDFPALHRGRVVYLCWRLGEERIAYWHEISTGFAGRRPIAEITGETP